MKGRRYYCVPCDVTVANLSRHRQSARHRKLLKVDPPAQGGYCEICKNVFVRLDKHKQTAYHNSREKLALKYVARNMPSDLLGVLKAELHGDRMRFVHEELVLGQTFKKNSMYAIPDEISFTINVAIRLVQLRTVSAFKLRWAVLKLNWRGNLKQYGKNFYKLSRQFHIFSVSIFMHILHDSYLDDLPTSWQHLKWSLGPHWWEYFCWATMVALES